MRSCLLSLISVSSPNSTASRFVFAPLGLEGLLHEGVVDDDIRSHDVVH